MPSSLEALLVAVAVILPGFVSLQTIQLKRPVAERSNALEIMLLIAFGAVNAFVWYWLLVLAVKFCLGASMGFLKDPISLWREMAEKSPVWTGLGTGAFLFVTPFFIGLWTPTTLGRKSGYPTAWDEFVSETEEVIVSIQLKSGRRIHGIFSKNSKASTNPRSRDIFLEREVQVSEDGQPEGIVEGSGGFWVNPQEIESLHVIGRFGGEDAV